MQVRLRTIERTEVVFRVATRSDHLVFSRARGCGHGDYFDLIRMQAEEQSQKVGQIGQGTSNKTL